MTIINFFCAAFLVGCLTSWVWCFVNKWEVSEGCSIAQWLEIHGGRFVGGVARCSFCFNWWLSWAVVIPAAVVTGNKNKYYKNTEKIEKYLHYFVIYDKI